MGLMLSPMGLAIVIVLGALGSLVIWLIWRGVSREDNESWPVVEGTIQSVGTVVVSAGRDSYSVEVAIYSYNVKGEYYSGRLKISPSLSSDDRAPRVLIHQKIQVRYDPKKPEDHAVDPQEVEGFVLDSWYEDLGTDIDPIDLNIDKA